MARALEAVVDRDEQFLDSFDELEWLDDVTEYLCTRCRKVLVQHYIANCQHKFCNNCRRLVGDGSQRWKCPNCSEYIRNIERQDSDFKDRVTQLRLYCPNRKYGCKHICLFKEIKEHFNLCKHTREQALPVPYRGDIPINLLEQLFQLRTEMRQMKQQIKKVEERKVERDVNEELEIINQSTWELSVHLNKMKKTMMELEKRQNDEANQLKACTLNINYRIDGVISDLNVETIRLKNDVSDLQKQVLLNGSLGLEKISSTVEDNKSKIIQLETKTDSYIQMFDLNNRLNTDLVQRLKRECENDSKSKEIEMKKELEKLEKQMKDVNLAQEKKLAESVDGVNRVIRAFNKEKAKKKETTSMENKNASQILAINAQIESFDKKLQKQLVIPMAKFSEKFEKMSSSLNEMRDLISTHEKMLTDLREVCTRMEIVESNEKKWRQSENQLKIEMKQLSDEILILNQILLKKTKETNGANESFLRPEEIFNSLIKPEVQHLGIVNEYYKKAPDFTWIVGGFKGLTHQSQREWLSEVFPLKRYPFGAQAKIALFKKSFQFYLCYVDTKGTNEPIELKIFPNTFFTLKDQSDTRNPKDITRTSTNTFLYITQPEYKQFYHIQGVDKLVLDSSLYNVNGRVTVDIHVEAPEVTQLVYSSDGTLTWAIEEYGKRKQLAVEGLIESYLSPYFYTSGRGYRVRFRAWLNGCDKFKNKGLSVTFTLLAGLYDDDLKEEFPHETTVTVFHPTKPHRKIIKSVTKEYRNCCWMEIGTHEEINKLLYNDTLYYKVTVTIIDV